MKTLREIYENYKMPEGDADKGTAHSYLEIYETLLSSRKENINFLEIGVSKGYSLMLWKDFFVNSKIIGLDINLSSLIFKPDGFEVYETDATDESKLNNILKDQTFDFIIDDGSHLLQHQVASFNILFPRLKKQGIYFIEDIVNIDESKFVISNLNPNFQIYDLRNVKRRSDDVLAILIK
jgi:hypothetical protein